MIDKPWLKYYEPGVPYTINPDEYSSLIELIEKSTTQFSSRVAFTNMGVGLTYQEINSFSQSFAGFLQKKCQLQPNDKVAIMMPNVLQYPVVMFGILKAGMVVVNVNPLYTVRELHQILVDSGAKVIVVLENFAHIVEKARVGTALEHVVVTGIGDLLGFPKGMLVNFVVKHIKRMVPSWHIRHSFSFKETIDKQYQTTFIKPDIKSDQMAYLQYTGGTTGGLKGAMLTHRNMVANLMQVRAWIKNGIDHNTKGGIINALPLYHIFSLTANCLTLFSEGITNILITNPRDIPGFVKELKRQPFAIITGVNTLFNALLHNPDFHHLDFSNLIFTLGGAMAVQKAVAEEWQRVTKTPILEAYGLTETCPAVSINPLNLKAFNDSVGLPVPSIDVKICDENGEEVALGEPGELLVKGPNVTKGYWNQPEETAKAITPDGWLLTGDIAIMDIEGFLYIVDRKKDMILVSGFNVYPNEVEDVIAEMKDVREVAVIGVPSEVYGEVVKAVIVPNSTGLTPQAVIDHCRKALTHYKIPKIIEFRAELPKTNVGKVLRRALRDEEVKKHSDHNVKE